MKPHISGAYLEHVMTSENGAIRNPFKVMDVPDPGDADVQAFAAVSSLSGGAEDANAPV